MTAKTTEKIWYEDMRDFFGNIDNMVKFIPDAKMSLNEQLNAAFRFSLYFSVLVGIIKRDIRILFFSVFVGFITFVVHETNKKNTKVHENMMQNLNVKYDRQKKLCTMPTKENPYMNVLMNDYLDFPQRPKACNINDKKVKRQIKEFTSENVYRDIKEFTSENVYRDVDDIFDRNVADRQFVSNPVTTIPNNQGEFAHWLYNNGETCKENGIKCSVKY